MPDAVTLRQILDLQGKLRQAQLREADLRRQLRVLHAVNKRTVDPWVEGYVD